VLVVGTREEYSWLLCEGDETWLQQELQGQLDVSRIRDLEKVISYVTKCAFAPNSLDNMFVHKAPLLKHATKPRSTYPWH
jgi:hypothetical protein